MAAGNMVSGAFSSLLTKDFEKVFFDEYMRHESEHSKVAKFENWDQYEVKEGTLAGLGAMQTMTEGQGIPYESFEQWNNKTVRFTNYGLGAQITENAYEDDLKGHMKKAMQELGKSAAYTRETEYWDIFNSGFGTTRAGKDSLALFSASHTMASGLATLANLTTAASLSLSTLQAACDTFENLKNEKNIPIICKPKLLIIPPALRWKAEELLMSEFKPETADNDVNALKNITGLQYMVCHFLTSTTAWFVVSDDHDLRFMWRRKIKFQGSDDFNTGNALYKSTGRFTCDFMDWRGSFGNAGA